jgi:hypothetical protein
MGFSLQCSILVKMEVNVSLLQVHVLGPDLEGIYWKRPTLFAVVLFVSNPPSPSATHHLTHLPLSLYSISVAGSACLGKLMGEGGGVKNKTTTKKKPMGLFQ